MAITCGIKWAKSVLLVCNLFIWLSGCALLVLGAWLLLEPAKAYLLHLVATPETPAALHLYLAYVLVALGGIIIVVGFFGCCGALQESRCLIFTYYVFLMLILVVEVALTVASLVFVINTCQGLEERLLVRVREDYGSPDQQEFSHAIDFAQYRFNCCGIVGDDDYVNSHWVNKSVTSLDVDVDKLVKNVPSTCCVLGNETVSYYAGSPISVVSRVFYGNVEEEWQNPQPRKDVPCQAPEDKDNLQARHKQGCINHLVKWFKRETGIISITCLVIGIIDILSMAFSIFLCRNLTDDI